MADEKINPTGYFSHYFREWGGKISALESCRDYAVPENDAERNHLELCEKSLRNGVKTFAERIGKDHPEGLRAALAEFDKEIEKLDALAEEYNSIYANFEEQPDYDGIEALAQKADEIKKGVYRTRGI